MPKDGFWLNIQHKMINTIEIRISVIELVKTLKVKKKVKKLITFNLINFKCIKF